MKANHNENKFDTLTELELRPVSQVFNQIRYWSALDDADEEKWDYISHYTRTERREMGIGGGSVPRKAPSAATGGFNAKPLIAALLIVLLLVSMGTGGYLAWPYLQKRFSSLGGGTGDLKVVTGYMMHLGSRDLGVIEDKAAMETFVSEWLAGNNAAAGEGIAYKIAQEITYDEVQIDAPYCATLQDAQSAFVKHATLDLA